MYKLTFELKQHTPLIHFQPEQKGATLRASELKPRFDRFFLKKSGGNSYDKGVKLAIKRNLLIKGTDNFSLDYKMKIIATICNECIIEPPQPYFGNLDNEDNHKQRKLTSISREPIVIELRTNCSNLFDTSFISLFEEFIFTNNFGCRASKGFGSFTVEKVDPIPADYTSTNHLEVFYKYSFSIPFETNDKCDFSYLFQYIDLLSKLIRGGYNINGLYIKPLLFLYALDKGWQWDKKSIKQFFFNTPLFLPPRYVTDINSPVGYFSAKRVGGNLPMIRSILGLATSQKWKSISVSTTDVNGEIIRNTSPIFYKPVIRENKFIIYFDWCESNNGIWGKSFITNYSGSNSEDLHLTVPQKADFKPNDFMEFIVNNHPRKYFCFKIDCKNVKRLLDKDNTLMSTDKAIIENKIILNRGLDRFDFKRYRDSIGKSNFSLFDLIKPFFNWDVTPSIFSNENDVKKFIDKKLLPKQLNMIDLIFDQLNQQNKTL